jgi:hypothetical protein
LEKRDIDEQPIEGGKSFVAVPPKGQLADDKRKKRNAPRLPNGRFGRKINI